MKNINIAYAFELGYYFEAVKDNGKTVSGYLDGEVIKKIAEKIDNMVSDKEKQEKIVNDFYKEKLLKDKSVLDEALRFVSRFEEGETYKKGDITRYNNKIYICKKEHKASYETIPLLDNGTLWESLIKEKENFELYNHEKKYKKGEGCFFNGKNYKLIVDTLEGESPFTSPGKWFAID